MPPGAAYSAAEPFAGAYGPGGRRGSRFAAWTARRPVQLVAAGLAGALIGGALVGFLEAVTGDDHPRHGFYGRAYGPGPYMRGHGWRLRQWDGNPPWRQRPGYPGPGEPVVPPSAMPGSPPPPAVPAPTPSSS